jgi:hypothetical protein
MAVRQGMIEILSGMSEVTLVVGSGKGMDLWDPVPGYVAGTDHAELKREFGRDLSFWGGMSVQNVLPFGTAADVRREAARAYARVGRIRQTLKMPREAGEAARQAVDLAKMPSLGLFDSWSRIS